MAEILGAVASGLTLAGLLKLCLEAFEIIQVARKQTFELEKLCLRLNIERARLYTWAQTMDLISDDPRNIPKKPKVFPFEELVTSTLRMILSLFENSERLKNRYGCSSSTVRVINRDFVTIAASSTSGFVSVDTFTESFDNFGVRDKPLGQVSRLTTKARWVVEDRTKFSNLIQEIRDLIDGLQDITKSISTVARQEGVLRYSIQQIKDADTLNLLTEVCQHDYPDISDAASTKLDVLSLSTHKLEGIEIWMESTSDPIVDTGNDLESMNITELQQMIRTLTVQRPNSSTIPGDHPYDAILEEKNRLIREQEERINTMMEFAKERDEIISNLQDQLRSRLEVLQSSTEAATTQSSNSSQLQQVENNARSNRSTTTTLPSTQDSVEVFKSFRVQLNSTTAEVLPAALKKYHIMADWRDYALYIVYGDLERCLGLNEKPLVLFKQLDAEGRKPMFMLRKINTPGTELTDAGEKTPVDNTDPSIL